MHNSLDIFQTASAMARHAGARQAVVARNIANADTPGFQAQTIPPFNDVYRSGDNSTLRVTRASHMAGGDIGAVAMQVNATGGEPSPNGNTVSLEDELLNSVAVSREHNRALTIYRHAMTVIRTSLGRG